MFPVPASNLFGGPWKIDRSKVTSAIMLPPPCHGGVSAIISVGAVEHADSGGPKILWPENTKKSAPSWLHVDRDVRNGLGAVDEHPGAVAVTHLDDLLAPG